MTILIVIGSTTQSSHRRLNLEHHIRQRTNHPIDVKALTVTGDELPSYDDVMDVWSYGDVVLYVNDRVLIEDDVASIVRACSQQVTPLRTNKANEQLVALYTRTPLPHAVSPSVVVIDNLTNTIPAPVEFNTTQDPTSLAWCYDHRYELSSQDEQAKLLDPTHQSIFSSSPLRHPYAPTPIAICEAIHRVGNVEYRVSDFSIPPSYVTPVNLFPGADWNVLVWSYDPYSHPINHPILGSIGFIQDQLRDKDAPYMPKAYGIDSVELGWIAYDVLDGAIIVHHNQIPGSLKGRLSTAEELWMYRYMIRTFCQSTPAEVWMVESSTLHQCSIRTTGVGVPLLPFSKRVAPGSGFKLQTWNDLINRFPTLSRSCILSNYVPVDQIRFWKYDKQHSIGS